MIQQSQQLNNKLKYVGFLMGAIYIRLNTADFISLEIVKEKVSVIKEKEKTIIPGIRDSISNICVVPFV